MWGRRYRIAVARVKPIRGEWSNFSPDRAFLAATSGVKRGFRALRVPVFKNFLL